MGSSALAMRCKKLSSGLRLSMDEIDKAYQLGLNYDVLLAIQKVRDDDVEFYDNLKSVVYKNLIKIADNDKYLVEALDSVESLDKLCCNKYSYILNMAIMTTDDNGSVINSSEKLESIRDKYGIDSDEYTHAIKAMAILVPYEFDNR